MQSPPLLRQVQPIMGQCVHVSLSGPEVSASGGLSSGVYWPMPTVRHAEPAVPRPHFLSVVSGC